MTAGLRQLIGRRNKVADNYEGFSGADALYSMFFYYLGTLTASGHTSVTPKPKTPPGFHLSGVLGFYSHATPLDVTTIPWRGGGTDLRGAWRHGALRLLWVTDRGTAAD